MRLDRYLIEKKKKVDIMPYLDTIEKNCSKILKVYQKAGHFIYRGAPGVHIGNTGTFIEKKPDKKVRKPRNTPIEIHRYLNKLFKEKFGWNVRDGISTTPAWVQAHYYGHVYIFLPTDRYKFAWSPKYGDLYVDMPIVQGVFFDNKEFLEKRHKTFQRAVNTFKDDDLVGAIRNGYDAVKAEIMFKVNKYYLLEFYEGEEDLRLALGMSPRK